jgi:hypothetical protein
MDLPNIFKKVCERNGWKCLGNKAEIPLSGGRKQQVEMQLFKHANEEMVRFLTEVGSVVSLNNERAIAALRVNANLPHGALAIAGEQLVLVDTFLLREADHDEVESSIRYLTEAADRYERLIYKTDAH